MPYEKMENAADIAVLLVEMSQATFQELLVFEIDKGHNCMYLPKYCGVWQKQCSNTQLIRTIKTLQDRIHNDLIKPLTVALQNVRTAERLKVDGSVTSAKQKSQAEEVIESHLQAIKDLYKKLGTTAFVNSVLGFVIAMRSEYTSNMGFSLNMFDCVTEQDVVVFKDGVHDFHKREYLHGKAAQDCYMTEAMSLDICYEDLLKCSKESKDYKDCYSFLCKIFGKEHMRNYVLKMFSNSLRMRRMKRFFIHYNLSGDNGKTTFFNLVKTSLGNLFTRCNNGLLYTSTQTNPNQSNEELMSIKGKAVILFSEPSHKQKLNVSFMKDLTGGDDQTARHNYGSKQQFTFNGSPHILCNRIPQLEDVDGGVQSRLRCIPYESRFVSDTKQVCEEKNVHLVDTNIDSNFKRWKLAFIYMLFEKANEELIEPEEVKEHTKRLMDRDNITKAYIEDRIVKSEDPKKVLLSKDVYLDFVFFCKENNIEAVKKDVLENDISTAINCQITQKSGNLRNFWRGWEIANIFDEGQE